MIHKRLICEGALFLSFALHDALAGKEIPTLEEAPTQNIIARQLIALENELNDCRGSYNELYDSYTDELVIDTLERGLPSFSIGKGPQYSILEQYRRKIEGLEKEKSTLMALLKTLPFEKEWGERNEGF